MPDNSYEDFVRYMSRHQRQIWWFINSLLPSVNDTDDVLQETSVVLWRKWNEFDSDRNFLNWAFGIARLQVFRFVRENRSKRLYLDEQVLGEIADAAEKQAHGMVVTETRLDLLKQCLQSLSEEGREVVEARYFKGWSTKKIAESTSKPLASVYTLLRRARLQLMQCVALKIQSGEAS